MSINASAVIFLKNEFESINSKINFAFEVQKLGNENKIGVNQGGNIKPHTINAINYVEGESCDKYVIEIADDPLDFNAEYIFGGYDFDLESIDENDSFESRIFRIKKFIKDMLDIPFVEYIKLYINISVGTRFKNVEVNISDFEKFLIELFICEGGWTPSLCLKVLNK